MRLVGFAALASSLLCSTAVAQSDPQLLWTVQPSVAQSEGEADAPAPEPEFWLNLNPQAFAAPPGRSMLIPIPGVGFFEARIASTGTVLTGGHRLSARFTDGAGELHLQRGLNVVHGGFTHNGWSWRIRGSVNGPLVIERDPGDRLGEDMLIPDKLHTPRGPRLEAGQSVPGNGVVDIFFLYDQSLIDEYGWGLADLAANDVGVLHDAFDFSGVPLGAAVTDMEFIDTPPEYGGYTLIGDMLNERGIFAGYGERTRTLGADILSANQDYVAGRDSFCGVAYLLDSTINYPLRPQYNVCHGSMVLAHETGHNLGLSHGIATDGPGTGGAPERWAQGFRIDSLDRDGGIYTSIMAYGSQTRPYSFSDPDRPCPERGSVCGIPVEANGDGADASRALTEFATQWGSARTPLDRLATAVLPTSRFVETGTAATAFMTVINPNTEDGTGCRIRHHGPDRENFSFQETDPATNGLIGVADDPFTLPAGGSKTFLISLTPSADVSGVAFAPFASCANVPMNAVSPGLNAVNLGAAAGGGPDVIALSATVGGDGVVDIPDDGRPGAFAVATLNLGSAGDITVSALSLDPVLPATAQICQTDSGGACIAPRADSVTLNVPDGAAPTFAVFVRTDYPTPFAPTRRVQVQLESGGVIRGSTSVAVRDQAGLEIPSASGFGFDVTATLSATGALADYADGFVQRFQIVDQPTDGSLDFDPFSGEFTYEAGPLGGADSFSWRVRNTAGWSDPATVNVTVNALPLPITAAFTVEDDAGMPFRTDLDEFAEGEIDRFILTTPPAVDTYEFNPLSGVISFDLPADAGPVDFAYRAENTSGQSNISTARVDVVDFTPCLPRRATRDRVMRRIVDYAVTDDGETTIEEAEAIITHLCLTDITRNGDGDGSYAFLSGDPLGGVYVFSEPQDDPDEDFYRVYYVTQNSEGNNVWTYAANFCKTPGETTLEECD